MPSTARSKGTAARAIELACEAFALAGGAILAGMTLIAVASIVGRNFGRPIQGDFELVQIGCAVSIAFFLPYCQLRKANIIVDFFTSRAGLRTRAWLDAAGSLLVGLMMALLAWRTGAGTIAMEESRETSMIMSVPIWYGYALMTPAFGLGALTGAYTAWCELQPA